jgi:hypothetical protein
MYIVVFLDDSYRVVLLSANSISELNMEIVKWTKEPSNAFGDNRDALQVYQQIPTDSGMRLVEFCNVEVNMIPQIVEY